MNMNEVKNRATNGDVRAISCVIAQLETVECAAAQVLPWLAKAVEMDAFRNCVMPSRAAEAMATLRRALIPIQPVVINTEKAEKKEVAP